MGASCQCAECGAEVLLAAGRPVVRGGNVVIVCAAACAPRPAPESAPAARAPRRRRPPRPLSPHAATALALASAVFLAAPAQIDIDFDDPYAPMVLAVDPTEAPELESRVWVPAPEHPAAHALDVVWVDGEAVELVWYHPIAGKRLMPGKADRRFGAERTGTRPECGNGHCGVDLGGVRGTVIHAVRPGRVARIMRTADRKGGLYVKLEHEYGFNSWYMHLDDISPELVVGMEVAAGEPLGTLGRTGIQHSGAHLHFQVSRQDEWGGEVFVDPEPMLRQAIVLEEPAELQLARR